MQIVKFFAPVLLCVGLLGCNNATTTDATKAPAEDSASGSGNDVQARQQIMEDWGDAMKTMGGMVKNPSTFNAETFKTEAGKFSADPWKHFGAGTEGGDSKPEVWSKATEFQAEVDKFKTTVTALNTAVQSATNVEGVQGAFGDVSASCKSCHKVFKTE